ncbi:MAG: ABC transporter ATP-binding protein [Candidatus Yanofskybacteria bacterium RIFCSPHIGHO2_01_FULL_43_42]|uniref:ABC transporter ATP-binding protein n=1 Tax=Candidatus Yanofskybacteria bacterium RIFCSPLOWO2_01_FULL_43_22 TaxID=1802695 RepID=A0A1F8GD42_9BACT|nr:MAG: ABC transporter ATP-binding protein [Candidatus Yanofskybacteria bacterium RIFCSPHIGHO2_01_FULL_43_42]OGN12664.1 MAG: ABC transporter ATP-binding protein [Candidatus Yanofskybacteria bacterium RIFCSPHIGHO2_02_FULL_43_17]OGN23287.1 MAG: ABC transporter ATP-binding protein [Candidatus Yanofskybacteria bacterium RIFCSPLOWO2_01_FULL_43_22]
MKEIILNIQNLTVSFDNDKVIDDLDFSVKKGDVIAIVGPNGAGKSVLFRTLMGLVPHLGKIEWSPGLKISYVPQKFSAEKDFPLTAREFLHLKSKNQDKITSALESVGLKNKQSDMHHIKHHLLDQRLGWLSGGQLQRILIAWAILDNPDVLLFDEPTTGIDIGGEETIYNLLKKLNDEMALTILLISHDLNIVYKYANSVLCLNKEKICFGPPREVLDPQALIKLYGGEAKFYKHEHKN